MYLTAKEAAEELGVSIATLYAYVSRKQIRSQSVPQSKHRLYWQEDIERLKSGPREVGRDVLVPSSTITLLTPSGHYYRGRSAVKLAEHSTLEETCGLLWGPASKGAFDSLMFQRTDLYDRMLEGLAGSTTLVKAAALLPVLERGNPRAYDLSPAGFCRTGAEMMRWFAGLICGLPVPTSLPLHEAIATGLAAPPGYADIIRRLFVLGADHELDPSTYAVRSIANTGVSPYQIATAGLAAAVGRRLTFGRAQALSQMLNEIMTLPDSRDAILRRLAEGESIYGFESRIYSKGDPRAAALMGWLNAAHPDDPDLIRFNRAIVTAEDVTGKKVDFVLPLSFIGFKLGLKGGQEGVLLRLARMAGWIAHALEQYNCQDLVRPRTVYLGELPDQISD